MRLIDADELMKKFYDIEFNAKHELFGVSRDLALEGLKHIKKALKGMPTIDPVKHGRWEESKCLDDCFWVCSCCKFPSQAVAAPKLYKYCPNCGARMDGDGK